MAKMKCECGFVFRFGEGSLPGEHVLVPDGALAEILEQDEPASAADIIDRIDHVSRGVFFCQSCDRVYMEEAGKRVKARFVVYRPVDGPDPA